MRRRLILIGLSVVALGAAAALVGRTIWPGGPRSRSAHAARDPAVAGEERAADRRAPDGEASENRAAAPDAGAHRDQMRRRDTRVATERMRELVAAFRAARDPAERGRLMEQISLHHKKYVRLTDDMAYVPFLREVATHGSGREERRWAVIATHTLSHGPIVDMNVELLGSPHPEVRFMAAETLGWVRGEHAARARDNLARALEHSDAKVRAMAADSLGILAKDAAYIEPVIDRLAREENTDTAVSLAFCVLRLDPEQGADRIERRLLGADEEAREAGRAALARAESLRQELAKTRERVETRGGHSPK